MNLGPSSILPRKKKGCVCVLGWGGGGGGRGGKGRCPRVCNPHCATFIRCQNEGQNQTFMRSYLINSKAGVFLGFSFSSTVLGVIIIICYSISTAFRNERHPRPVTVIILILGIIEFAIGIWAAVCLFCICCNTPAQQVSHPRVMRSLMRRWRLRPTVNI